MRKSVQTDERVALPSGSCEHILRQRFDIADHNIAIQGHSQQLPHQLNLVPPALARKVADKLHPHPLQETPSMNLSAQPGQ